MGELMGQPVRRIAGISPCAIPFDDLFAAQEPVVIEGLASGWPLVERGLAGPTEAADYLRQFGGDSTVTVFTGPPEICGRFHYNADLTGMNFTSARESLADVLDRVLATSGRADEPAIYVGSTDHYDFYLDLRPSEPTAAGIRTASYSGDLQPGL